MRQKRKNPKNNNKKKTPNSPRKFCTYIKSWNLVWSSTNHKHMTWIIQHSALQVQPNIIVLSQVVSLEDGSIKNYTLVGPDYNKYMNTTKVCRASDKWKSENERRRKSRIDWPELSGQLIQGRAHYTVKLQARDGKIEKVKREGKSLW